MSSFSLNQIFRFPPKLKLAIEVTWDTGAILLTLLVSYWMRIGIEAWSFSPTEWGVVVANLFFTQGILVLLGHYRQMIRFIEISAVYKIGLAMLLSSIYLVAAEYVLDIFLPASVLLLYFFGATAAIAAPRLLIQATSQAQNDKLREKCFVYGASGAGRTLVTALRAGKDLMPIAFVDDKRIYHGKEILGLPVISREEIPELKAKHDIHKMLLAVNNTSRSRRKELIEELEPYALELLSVPNVQDIASGKQRIDELQEVKIEDLLGRDPVPPIVSLLNANITDKVVLVTGAGGSIGSELCRQIVKGKPRKLVLLELSEFNLYQIENELKRAYPELELVSILATIQDTESLRNTIETHKIQTIYHAAAYKHVPMVESNITAGIRNNIFGTANVALIAAEYEVEKFVLVSTDKAVRPTNIMGATKRFAELFVQGISALHSETEFSIVRFGNVLGSSGSVVPLFNEQIRKGGPITVTHPDIIRYFMTIPEAAQLVIQAGAMGKRGEVFVLDMGEPVKIADLAEKMAHLMGFKVTENPTHDGEIAIRYTGLRPGEKLYEELLIGDNETATEHPRIMAANEISMDFAEVVMLLDQINYELVNRHEDQAIAILASAPLAYKPDNAIAQRIESANQQVQNG
ncbi:polysaccharide biosynthesis protein [Alteromonas facilis]|uniref:polysaccharide biosynthesis protein n=1 Tax=Alteromonas facilis TaxID=2048004 RepID=UPI000C283B85|nr:nucleoside-diphosphate sugar epimerase/dehydratase [Alteromonas facilis]